jgi:DNA-binding MarR family transcriptional regulator
MSEREQSAYRLAKLIKKVRRQMSNAIRAELEPIGVSLPVVQVLKSVAPGRGLSQLELAQEIELEPGALSRLLADLEDQRLITRRRDPSDKRRVLMAATASGLALLARAQPRMWAGIDRLFSPLTRAEHADLCRLLEKLAHKDQEPGSARRQPAATDGAPVAARARHRRQRA